MRPQDLDARWYAQELSHQIPECADLHAISNASDTLESLQALLDCAAELLLHPEQTVRVARALRPLLLDVVARALSSVRDGSGKSLGCRDQTPIEREEGVLVAMSRLLPAAHHILPLALNHWRASPCPFEFVRASGHASRLNADRMSVDQSVTCTASSDERDKGVTLHRVRRVVEAVHRLLSAGVPGLHDLWSWAPFFDLCRHNDVLVRWRAVGICAVLLELDEQGRRTLLTAANASNRLLHDASDVANAEGGAAPATGRLPTSAGELESELVLEAELDLLQQLRDARTELHPRNSHLARQVPESSSSDLQGQSGGWGRSGLIGEGFEGGVQTQVPYSHHPDVADLGGILHPTRSSPSGVGHRSVPRLDSATSRSRLVSTASSRRNLSRLSLAMVVDRPILLHGPAGCGKSLLAREAAFVVGGGAGQTPLLELHLDDQTDSKSLLGSHTCTDVPGEFAWRPGALTRAAVTGTWVLIEDLDRAPFEVLAALGPLLEGRPLTLPGRSKPLRAAPGFRVFGTVTTVGPGRVTLGVADFGALWTHVSVEPLSVEEVLEVAQVRHPALPRLVSARLLDTMRIARGDLDATHVDMGTSALLSTRAGGRVPSVRDFFKLCARVDRLGIFDSVGNSTSDGFARAEGGTASSFADAWICSEAQALAVTMESLDVFAGHLSTKDALTSAADALAGQWNILPSKVVELALSRRPEFVVEDSFLRIGRVILPRLARANDAGSSFAPTSHALRLMESLAASVQACEPILLVGETGCGKTSLVQQLAQGSGRELVVQNLSLQTDGADLLGGFRPVELRQLAQEVLQEFLRLFPTLFSASQNRQFCDAVTASFERRQWKRLSAGLKNAAKIAMQKLDRSEERVTDPATTSNKSQRPTLAGGMTSPSGRRRDWDRFSSNVGRFEHQRLAVEGSFAFSFVEGVLVKAIREGKWVLLDEINLASAETLQRLSGLLEGSDGSICLTERGDVDHIARNPDFRLFAAMNPPTDASKKDLPPALRRRFSEVYVPELEDRMDLKRVADGYLAGISPEQEHLAFTAVDLYLWARKLARENLSDGAGQRPRYSLRTLVAALSASRRLVDRGFHARRAMVEGCRGAFETQLNREGRDKILKGVMKAFGKGITEKDLEKPPRRPGGRTAAGDTWIRIGPFWLEGGPVEPVDNAILDTESNLKKFVLTPSVQSTLRCLARTVASTDSPVLLQGPTSAGKTSIVEYLARRLGHRCVRINNHEHTDIQEYTGSYAADANGKLVFQEGILVEALRKGYWIILDELNLAPSEVLEALNRLLDHNRELYVPETQETIKPHPSFHLFATQNPPGAYGGRKPLSRAFRNRFMEVHVDDIPGEEWETILVERCGLAPSHCKLLVKVFKELQAQRHSSRLFLGKHSAISPRDLLRWAGRKPFGKQEVAEEGWCVIFVPSVHMPGPTQVEMQVPIVPSSPEKILEVNEDECGARRACDGGAGDEVVTKIMHSRRSGASSLALLTGYMLLAERLRTQEEKDAMKSVLEGQVGVALDVPALYGGMQPSVEDAKPTDGSLAKIADNEAPLVDESDLGGLEQLKMVELLLDKGAGLEAGLKGVAMTRHMRRLFRLTGRCLSHLEPVLLVGETGCGKTTVCQLYSMLLGRRMHVVNCHQNTEAADLLGGLRPLRGREALVSELRARGEEFMSRCFGVNGATPSQFSGFSTEIDVDRIVSTLQEVLKAARDVAAGGGDHYGQRLESRTTPVAVHKRPRMEGGKDVSAGEPAISETRTDSTPVEASPGAEPSTGTSGAKDVPARSKRRRKNRVNRGLPSTEVNDKRVMTVEHKLRDSTSIPTPVKDNSSPDLAGLADELDKLRALAKRTKGLFEWVDGPLVSAMRNGELVLLDELSLADDAVLERLNSVLEPGRSITLAEKGGERSGDGVTAETVTAAPGFRVMATMNPGGDFGKRELSPALRSRFTEVWVPALSAREDMEGVVVKAFNFGEKDGFPEFDFGEMALSMLEFAWWFNKGGGNGVLLSVRDLLSWAGFITDSLSNVMNSGSDRQEDRALRPWEAYVHGAALVLLDGLGLGSSLPQKTVMDLRRASADRLSHQIPDCFEREVARAQLARDGGESSAGRVYEFVVRERRFSRAVGTGSRAQAEFKRPLPAELEQEFGILPFFTACGPGGRLAESGSALDFSIRAPTTAKNLHRVLRALQVPKAVLLEGSPGVGKTSLVAALAAVTGHELVRINLSEQTDATDLFGSDLPVPEDDGENGSSNTARFAWCDGVFLRALKEGKWVLLDELNLATQSVLEGLNACLDHRAEVFIPELGRSFRCPPTFKVFAAQNPLAQGGGRKGLPRSFLSRFTKVFVDPLTTEDLLYIAANKFPALATARSFQGCHGPSSKQLKDRDQSLLARMIKFNSLVQEDIEGNRYGRKGSPWEFNLRDVFRWCELMLREQGKETIRGKDDSMGHAWEPWLVIDTLYTQRMRTSSDRAAILARFKEVFPEAFTAERSGVNEEGSTGSHVAVHVSPPLLRVGQTVLRRGSWGHALDVSGGGKIPVSLPMPIQLRPPLQALARCVAMGWPALVVGHRGSGKTSLIHGLASAVGARLTEVAMTPSMDVTELLGCFEQTDLRAAHEALRDALQAVVRLVCAELMSLEGGGVAEGNDSRAKVASLWDIWHAVEGCYKEPLASSVAFKNIDASSGFDEQGLGVVRTLLGVVRDAVKLLSHEKNRQNDVRSVDDTSSLPFHGDVTLGAIKQRIGDVEKLEEKVRGELHAVRSQDPDGNNSSGSCFRWNDGLLVEALERGDWMLLDAANLCPASVLDRLNPLLEPGGVLLLTECGVPSDSNGVRPHGGHRVVRPHPNFRLFLTADPSCGEVSRAMRNRCVEMFVLETLLPPTVAADGMEKVHRTAGTTRVERLIEEPDAVGVLYATGVRDVREGGFSLGIQRRNRLRSSRFSRNSVRDYRQLVLYGELATAVKNRALGGVSHAEWEAPAALAYPEAEGFGPNEDGDGRGSCAVNVPCVALAQPGWRDLTQHGRVVNAVSDSRILQVACLLAQASSSGRTQRTGQGQRTGRLECTMVDDAYSPGVDVSFLSDGHMVDASWSNRLMMHAAALYARRTSACDRRLRSLLTKRMHCSESLAAEFPLVEVKCMMSLLIDTESWAEISTFASTLAREAIAQHSGPGGVMSNQGGVKEMAMFCVSRFSLPVMGSRSEMYSVLERVVQARPSWGVFRAMLLVHEILVVSRLYVRAREGREFGEARARLHSAVVDEHGLSWMGLSYLASEGGRDLSRSGGRTSWASGETRLARTSLVQYLVPLVRCVDALAELLCCKEIMERICSEGDAGIDDVLNALSALMGGRDTTSTVLLGERILESRNVGETSEQNLFDFPWDEFLVAWGWLQEAVGTLWDKLPKVVREIDEVANAWAALSAVRSRVGMAVVQHAGGRRASRNTLWVKGSRARVAATKDGAQGLARLHRASESFELQEVLVDEFAGGGVGVVSMARLMASLHPSLCVSREIRSELLHGVTTLHWAACEGLESGRKEVDLAQMLPQVAEELIKTAQSKLEMRCKGVRLGPSEEDAGVDMGTDVYNRGCRFDEFEAEEAAALANATLVVGVGEGGNDDDFGDGDDALGRLGVIQLAPFVECWLAGEECEVLTELCQVYVELNCTSSESEGVNGEGHVLGESCGKRMEQLMSRVKKVIDCIICTPSLPPSVGWPYQTLSWAWEQSGMALVEPLLSHVLPVALDGWARRLWQNVYSMPGLISGELGPPPMLPAPAEANCSLDRWDGDNAEARGPVQMMALVRTWTLLRLCSTAVFHASVVTLNKRDVCGQVDLTLMNAEARVAQFRGAMRLVRDLRPSSRWVLVPLLDMIWARVSETLSAFDGSGGEYSSKEVLRAVSGFRFGRLQPFDEAWGRVESRVRALVDACADERVGSLVDLLMSTIRAVCHASVVLYAGEREDTRDARAVVGLASALVGCVRFELLMPSTPVDPGLRPAIEKGLVGARLMDLRCELVVEHLASRIDGGPDVTPEMTTRLRKARCLGQECRRLEKEAIERLDDRPPFTKLFHDVRSYADGIGSASRVSSIAGSLANLAGMSHGLSTAGAGTTPGREDGSVSSSAVLREERMWQDSTVEFLNRCRKQFMPAYADVVTSICEAVESCRLGLRLMSSAVEEGERTFPVSRGDRGTRVISSDPLEGVRSFLLQFPCAVCDDRDGDGDALAAQLRKITDKTGFENALKSSMSGSQHVAVLLAALSRAELLLSARCCEGPVVAAIVSVLDSAVSAWSQAEAEEAERRRKEAEILQYKTQEHTVKSEQEKEEARLRTLFPDYHGGYSDIVRVSSGNATEGNEGAAANNGEPGGTEDEWVASLGYLSNEQLGLLVASHARVFCGLLARRRGEVRRLVTAWRGPSSDVVHARASDAERLAAHGDCYRACILLGVSTWRAPSYVGARGVKSGRVEGTTGSSEVVFASDGSPGCSGGSVQLEAAYSPVHLLALADASVLCTTGRNLLEHVVASGTELSESSGSSGARAREGLVPRWGGDRATNRSLMLVDPFSDFQLDANVGEVRLAYRPLSTVLGRVGSLLEEFPGNGILITVARVADRVRRMPLHSPVAAVLAGVELVLRRAHDWEQYAHRGVSLKDDLRPLSALVVRWRELELKSWSDLLDGRERAFVSKANRWWLHLFRLLTGKWEGEGEADDDSQDPAGETEVRRTPTSEPDWPSARKLLPDWLWSGLPTRTTTSTRPAQALTHWLVDHNISQQVRDLFKNLDDFIRTSPVGEFFARLHMLRSFAAQLSLGATPMGLGAAEGIGRRHSISAAALGTLLRGLWVYYSQFSEDVTETRNFVRRSLEKKLKEEAKLGRWDEQTYYSLAESSEKSHRKLTKLVMQYDEVLEVSFAEVLHKTLVAGVGERKEQTATTMPSTEIPPLGAMFAMVKKVDTAIGFVDEDSSAEDMEASPVEGCIADVVETSQAARSSKLVRPSSKAERKTPLELLRACFPVAPSHQPDLVEWELGQAEASASVGVLPWLREAIFGCKSCSVVSAELPLLARLPSLSRRMQSLLRRWVYGNGLKDVSVSDLVNTGRPAGFVGAGLAEELCSAVFARIEALRAKGVGKQVKKRAVLDLLGGLRQEGVEFARACTPKETSDMLHVMGLSQPFSEDRLAGVDGSWVVAGESLGDFEGAAIGVVLEGAERYYLRGICELSRLRMEASAPASRDLTRREVEIMRGLADNLAVVVLQQRGVTAVLEAEVVALAQETRAFKALVDDVRDKGGVWSCDPGSGSESCQVRVRAPLPSHVGVGEAVEEQRKGLYRAVESLREVLMLIKAVEMGDPPSCDGSRGKEWGIGDRPTDANTLAAAAQGVRKLESSISGLLDRVQQFPECVSRGALESVAPLLGHGALRRVLVNQEALRKCGTEALDMARRFAHVIPAWPMERIGHHCEDVVTAVECLMIRRGVLGGAEAEDATGGNQEGPGAADPAVAAAKSHVSNVGSRLSEAVKALLLSVQALSPREMKGKDGEEGVAGEVAGADDPAEGVQGQRSVEYSLHEAHVRAFTEAHALKLGRCIGAMSAVRESIRRWTEDGFANSDAGVDVAKEAQLVVVRVAGDVVRLAEQVLGAGKAILTGMVAFNKGTAKLHYVVLRVFRTLLSKGLCSDETEEDDGEGQGDGDIQGMKFEDDVEGTGMGEGDGKKDVTDEIEDEEQLLGLKGEDEQDKEQQESRELEDDEKDTGMEMENDFEGQMFDVPKGDEKGEDDNEKENADEKEELDREMGDLGDEADVVDEKLWDGDEEEEEEGNDQPEKFESGSRLDGEKPEEDEIRTKEEDEMRPEGKKQQQGQGEEGDDEQGEGEEAGKEDPRDVKGEDGPDEDQDGEEKDGEGRVNDDLEENYEDKPMGVEVRADDEAMEVDEQGRGEEVGEDETGDGEEKVEELPDNMDLDGPGVDEEDDGGAEDGQEDGEGSVGEEPEPQGKEGFESLAPEEDGGGDQQELVEDEEQPQGSKNPGAPELDAMEEDASEAEAEEDEVKDDGSDVDQRKAEEDEPPAFGVEGQGGDDAMLESSVKEEGEKAVEEEGAEGEQADDQGQDEKGGGGTGAAEGGDDGGGTGGADGGDGGQLKPQVSQGKGVGESQGRDKRRRPEAPNPFRNPGDAMRHWHRRLEMLTDNAEQERSQDEAKDESAPQDEGEDEKGEGTYEYVSSGEKGSGQVLGGVSDEQAAEAAAQEASRDEGDDAQDGDEAEDGPQDGSVDALDGRESMPEDPSSEPGAHEQNEDVMETDRENVTDARRKSSSRRDEEGHQARTEEEADADVDGEKQAEVEETPEEKQVLDMDALEEPSDPSSGTGAQVVTKPAGVGTEGTGVELSGSPMATMKLREQLLELAEELERRKQEAQKGESQGAGELWGRLRSVTTSLAQRLCEQLRLVLEPMLATKLQGDYRSGKRINMRRVIPYIASGFRKDKIWLRRTKAAKRDYQILLAIDDSESMADCGAGSLALAAMATVASGLTQLEVGQLAVARFGEEVDLLHAFGEPFTEDAGARIVEGFSFEQPRTNTARTLEGVVALLEEARSTFSVTSSGVGTKATPRQLVLLLSDGRFDRENKERLRSLVREMNERGQLLVMIVLDKEGDTSILKTREASYVGGKLVISNYLDNFPFPLYILLSHMEALPETLADALRQWFELLQRQASS